MKEICKKKKRQLALTKCRRILQPALQLRSNRYFVCLMIPEAECAPKIHCPGCSPMCKRSSTYRRARNARTLAAAHWLVHTIDAHEIGTFARAGNQKAYRKLDLRISRKTSQPPASALALAVSRLYLHVGANFKLCSDGFHCSRCLLSHQAACAAGGGQNVVIFPVNCGYRGSV